MDAHQGFAPFDDQGPFLIEADAEDGKDRAVWIAV
jgi:hypothetical protein